MAEKTHAVIFGERVCNNEQKVFLDIASVFSVTALSLNFLLEKAVERSQSKPFQFLRQEVSLMQFVVLLYRLILWVRKLPTANH